MMLPEIMYVRQLIELLAQLPVIFYHISPPRWTYLKLKKAAMDTLHRVESMLLLSRTRVDCRPIVSTPITTGNIAVESHICLIKLFVGACGRGSRMEHTSSPIPRHLALNWCQETFIHNVPLFLLCSLVEAFANS